MLPHKWVRGAALAATGVVMTAGIAFAHASVVSSDPAANAVLETAPAKVTVKMSEEIGAKQSSLTVMDAAGNRVDLGDSKLDLGDTARQTLVVGLKPLADGTYTVKWKAHTEEDNGLTEGRFSFTVKSAAEKPAAAVPAAPAAAAPKTLPKTGANLPLMALGGAGLALGGYLMRRLGRR